MSVSWKEQSSASTAHLEAIWFGRVSVVLTVVLVNVASAAELGFHGVIPPLHQPLPSALILHKQAAQVSARNRR